jgi:fumarate reductase flavoprotein subunit
MSRIPAEADVVVIGSGVSGLAAALTAAERGTKVIVFEKLRSLGGTSNFFKGTFAVESDIQRANYITYSRDEAFKNIVDYSHWRANARLVRAIVNESAETIAWLEQNGVEFTEVTINMINAPRTYHIMKGEGATVIKELATRAKEKGVDLILATPVNRIIKEGDRITGVIVEEDDEDVRVNTKAVIIATGGYVNNKEWIKKYTGFDLEENLMPIGNVDKMGDGIRMAWEVGAAEEGIETLELFRVGPQSQEVGGGGQVSPAAMQPDLWVNQQGERFCDESMTFHDTEEGNANARYKEGYTYSIFDDSIKQSLIENGIDKAITPVAYPGQRLTDLDRDLKAALETDNEEVFAADSIEELAEKIGVGPAVLKATVEEYNGFCEKGHDDVFAKDPKYLRPLKGPKFYAVKERTVCLGTMGGIKINHKTEVLDKKDGVIPGLYAVGYDAGGMYGSDYSMKVASGLSSAFAANSGRIAGRNASIYIGEISM